MHVYERRRVRLREVLRDISQADLARRSKISPTTISRYLKEPGTKGAKNISEENARKIEGAAGKPENWLDKQTTPSVALAPTPLAPLQEPSAKPMSLALALPVVLEALSQLPPLRWDAIRGQLDKLVAHPELIDEAVPEVLHQLSGSSRKRQANGE